MVEPFPYGDRWLLVYGVAFSASDKLPADRTGSEQVQDTFKECWTGDQWTPEASAALTFDSMEQAQEYLAKHGEIRKPE